MATVHFRNAVLVIEGADLSVNLTDLTVDYSAEMLDATTFGATTRIKKGGLFVAMISGKGFADFGDNLIEPVIFSRVGVDDSVVAVFPTGVTEGSTTPGGYAMKGVLSELVLGGQVGTLLPITFKVEARGIEA